MKQVRYLIEKVAPTEVPVLITGESGAGKEVAAHLIQSLSKRADKSFFIKNCATLQKELARSELFGHLRGSFTGAVENSEGFMYPEMIDILRPKYQEALANAKRHSTDQFKKGVGVAFGIYGSGLDGPDSAGCDVELNADGTITMADSPSPC